jgi:hypothetical protein
VKFRSYSNRYITHAELETGAKIYCYLRHDGRSPNSKAAQLCFFYEGADSQREAGHFEMSIHQQDGTAMVADVRLGGDHHPSMCFLNLSEELNQRMAPAVAAVYAEFVDLHHAKLEKLASATVANLAPLSLPSMVQAVAPTFRS